MEKPLSVSGGGFFLGIWELGFRIWLFIVKPLNRAIVKSISGFAATFSVLRSPFTEKAPVTGHRSSVIHHPSFIALNFNLNFN